jgi:hypothetical protein
MKAQQLELAITEARRGPVTLDLVEHIIKLYGEQFEAANEEIARLRITGKQLAMLCLQSERYGNDSDFKDATDNVLATW